MKTLWIFFVSYFVVDFVHAIKPYTGGGCLPGELVLVDCNLCTCDKHGRPNLICAKMWCFPQNPKTLPPSIVGPAHETMYEEEEDEAAAAEESDVILVEKETKIIVSGDDDAHQRMDEIEPVKARILEVSK